MTKKTSLWQKLKNAFNNAEPNAPSNPDNSPIFPANTGDSKEHMTVDLAQHADNLPSEKDFVTQFAEECLITADDIDVLLASMGYHFTYHPPKTFAEADNKTNNPQSPIHHFSMQISDGQVADGERDWGCLLRFFEREQLLAVYSIFPFGVPDTHRGEMLAVMAYLNYDLVIGNLELDIYDGEVRFKTSLDLEVTGLSELILSYLLQSNFAVTSRLYDTLADVVAKSAPAQSATEAVDNLLSAQQANTFYLMTDTIS